MLRTEYWRQVLPRDGRTQQSNGVNSGEHSPSLQLTCITTCYPMHQSHQEIGDYNSNSCSVRFLMKLNKNMHIST